MNTRTHPSLDEGCPVCIKHAQKIYARTRRPPPVSFHIYYNDIKLFIRHDNATEALLLTRQSRQ